MERENKNCSYIKQEKWWMNTKEICTDNGTIYYEECSSVVSNYDRKIRNEYIDLISCILIKNCIFLEIRLPNIVIVTDKSFLKDSNIYIDNMSNNMFIKETLLKTKSKDNIEIIYTISHECRHFWQTYYRPYIVENSKSKTRNKLLAREYNKTEDEIDADAWAVVIDSNTSNKKIRVFELFSKEYQSLVLNRIKEMTDEIKKRRSGIIK